MAILTFSKISKSFLTETVFSDISFKIEKNDKVGLIGNNGSGKSTLLKLITGEEEADSGSIFKDGDISIAYLEQTPEIDEDQTVIDLCLEAFEDQIRMEADLLTLSQEIAQADPSRQEELMDEYARLLDRFEEAGGYSYKSLARGVLIGLGFSEEEFDTRVASLSGGQKSRLHLASLLILKPDLLLLDEPTNHLDMKATLFLETYLQNYQSALIVVSHDRYFLDKVINRTFHIENKGLHIYECKYSDFVKRRDQRLKVLESQYKKQQAEVSKQEEIIERFSNYGRDRYKKQAESRRKALEKKVLMDKPSADSTKFKLVFTPAIQSGQDVLYFEHIAKSFAGQEVLSEVDFQVRRGERVGIIGDNGAGKSTLIKMVTGQLDPDQGQVHIGSNVTYAYYDQEQENLNQDNLVLEEIVYAQADMTISEARNYLAAFNFRDEEVFKEVGELSGGERSRLSLLKLMLERPNLLLMDEPTNHLDIESKEILENALLDYEGTLVIVSHDRYFLNKIADRIVLIENGQAYNYYGNYDYYLDKVSQVEEEEGPSQTKTSLKKERRKEALSQKDLRKLRADINKTEKEIEEKQEELDELKEKSYDSSIYKDYEKSLEIHKQIKQMQEEIDQLEIRWLDLSESLEEED